MLKRTALFILVLMPALAYAEVEVSTATGNSIQYDHTSGVAIIEGNAVVQNATATLKADKIQLNTKERMGKAQGHIVLEQSSSTLTGSEAEYYWAASTGTIRDAVGANSMVHFTADEMRQISPDVYLLKGGYVTTCDEVPPHYHIGSAHGQVRRGKRIKLYNAKFVPEDTPTFWTPFYTKSLVPKKYKLRIIPGSTSRDGFTNKTIFGYPFTENTWTNIRWDYLQRTGNGGGLEHTYNTPNLRGNFDSYYIRDINEDPQPQSKRYTILWNHYQRFTSRLTANAKLDVKSDQTFGNQFGGVGNQVYVENQTRGLLSEGGFTYQLPLVTLSAEADRKDKFDSQVSSKQFISKVTLPRLGFNTAPLTGKHVPFYTSFNGTFVTDTQDRTSPEFNLLYKKSATAGLEMKKEIRLKKKTWTFTPVLGFNEKWDNRILSSSYVVTETDQYVGRYVTGIDGRRRYFRKLDLRLGYRYAGRLRVNGARDDSGADDYGVESNQISGSFQTRVGRSTLYTLSSGYDLRNDPRSQPDKYHYDSSRVTPPSLDVQWEVKQNVNLFFRETYGVYDSNLQRPLNTPINTSGELQLGSPTAATYFSQGFAYSKKAPGAESQLFLTDKLKFYLSPKWYIDFYWSWRLVGPSKMDYRKAFPIEKTIRIVRDLHCWLLRMEFSHRTDRTEASFYIDLKSNMNMTKNVFAGAHDSVYSTRDDGPPLEKIFPNPEPTPAPSPASTPPEEEE